MNPRFPVYIPSKGRYQFERRLTTRALQAMGVPFKIVVEQAELQAYADAVGRENVLVLDPAYQERYDTCDTLGSTKTRGSGPARNFIWDHAVASGADWHWIMDDNIRYFLRLNNNTKTLFADGTPLFAMEDFTLRFKNVAMAGPQYDFFAARKSGYPPFVLNTRVFSCNLIRNDTGFRWRCRYNEDADLSLRMLKAGWCTILFNGFLQKKTWTQQTKGGNTDELYAEGTLAKSRMLVSLHSDVARLAWKFHRWHHVIDFSSFKHNRLILRDDAEPVQQGSNEFGLVLTKTQSRPDKQQRPAP